MEDATAKSLRRLAGGIDRKDELLREFVEVVGAAVGQVALGQAPNSLVGIQLRRVTGEVLQAQTWMLPEQFTQRFAFMRGALVQKHHQGAV